MKCWGHRHSGGVPGRSRGWWQGADKVVPGIVPVARLVSLAGCHAGSEDRRVHAVKAVRELVHESPVHPLRQSEGEKACFPQAGWPLGIAVAASLSHGRHVPPALSHSGQSHKTRTSSSCAAPQWGHAELVRMLWPDTLAAVHMAPAMRPRDRPHRPPRAQSPEGDRALRLKLTRGVAAKAVSDPVLELAEGLLHKVQGVLLPRDVPAPPALARAPAQGGRRAERAPHRARPRWAAPRFPDSLGEDLGDS